MLVFLDARSECGRDMFGRCVVINTEEKVVAGVSMDTLDFSILPLV